MISQVRRRPRRRVYWVMVALRVLSSIPNFLALYSYLNEARMCLVSTKLPSACAQGTLLPALWCAVSGYIVWLGLKRMIRRWVLTYSELAAVFRVITCMLINYLAVSLHTYFRVSRGTSVIDLQIWILVSVLLTTLYTLQTFVTSDIGTSQRGRTVDLFHIAVYAVIPIGLASFITMLALIRNLMVLQLYLPSGYSPL